MKKVGIVMGSDSDLPVVQKAVDMLKSLEIPYEVHIYSAHRTPVEARDFAINARANGFGALICAAGMAARGDGRLYVTQSAHMNFIRNRKEGTLYARAKVVNRGRTVVIVRVEIVDEKDCLLAEGTMDMFCVEKKS